MAQATNLTVKKADGTTDVTYTLQVASGGDNSPAIWQDLAASPVPNARPTFRLEAASNAAKTARRMSARFEYPYMVTNSDGTTTIVNRELFTATWIEPQDVPDDVLAESVEQGTGLLRTTLVRSSLKSGYAPV